MRPNETEHISQLNEREHLVLLHIIEQHVLTASPVGSRTISKQTDLHLSPASIRNIMSDLEERGLIGHPHTSAGRIPTDLGYRYYVDQTADLAILSENEKELIERHYEDTLPSAIKELIRESSYILSKITQQLAVVSAPSVGEGILNKLELVRVAENRVMVILSIRSGLVKSIILKIRSEISSRQLDNIALFLNERLAGLSLSEIRESFADRTRDVRAGDKELIRLFVDSSHKLFSEQLDSDSVSIGGMHGISQQPEFGNPEQMRNLIEIIENQNIIVHVLDNLSGEQAVTIRIGKEIADSRMRGYSIVASPYRVGRLSGTVSIVGPKRMNYPRIISIVDYISKLISS